MPPCNLGDEAAQRMVHVGERLAWTWVRKEGNEIDWVALLQRHPYFRLALEAADAWPVPGARIKDDDRPTRPGWRGRVTVAVPDAVPSGSVTV